MKKVCICGHFSFKRELLNGQTIKTKIICSELEKEYGSNTILKIDTAGSRLCQIISLVKILRALIICENIIILPAHNGVRIIAPFIEKCNRLFKRRLHYIVIGGWLPEYIECKNKLSKSLKKFDYIYVETHTMKQALDDYGFKNIVVMPNFKDLKILQPEDLVYSYSPPFKLCTFSRVTKEKGIELAISAVIKANTSLNHIAFSLDIYGQIDDAYRADFLKYMEGKPDYIKYCGTVSFSLSTDVLKNYFALMFPTYYSGEGFPGTLLDAMAAGVPVIASDWKYNSEIINDGYNGIILKKCDADGIAEVLIKSLQDQEQLNRMKTNVLIEAKKYLPKTVMKIIYDYL